MKILTADIGTGTQDIYLYDARLDIENGLKLVVPSPTMMVRTRIQRATQRQEAIYLTGVTMGGGPSHWAVEDHLKAGLQVYANPAAGRSFNDDLAVIREMGIEIISEDEASRLPDTVKRLELRDFDFQAIAQSLAHFDVDLDDLVAVAVAVFDHGAAPPDVSDRKFRFDYLDARLQTDSGDLKANPLSRFAYAAPDIPAIMTRMQAVRASASDVDAPLVMMDTAPAAILGATFEPRVARRKRVVIVNVGNFHTLAFRLGTEGVEGVFEHHTGLLDQPKLDRLLIALADGSLTREEVFNDQGHGALVYGKDPLRFPEGDWGVAVTGPRRKMMHSSTLKPHFPAPFGDMMMTGCFGMLAAVADHLPNLREPILASLRGQGGSGTPPWELS